MKSRQILLKIVDLLKAVTVGNFTTFLFVFIDNAFNYEKLVSFPIIYIV